MKTQNIICVLSYLCSIIYKISCKESIIFDEVEGDISMSKKEVQKMEKQLKNTGGTKIKLWKDGIIPYTISREFSQDQKDMINSAIQEITGDTCIQMIPRENQHKNYIHFELGNRCNSKIGQVGGKQILLLNPTCMKHGTIIHELIHGLGFWHEISRPDRDEYIYVKQDNVLPESRHNFQTYETPFTRTYQLPYDYASIMHYSRYAFQKKIGLETVIPKMENVPIGLRTTMSYFDKLKINLAYKCKS